MPLYEFACPKCGKTIEELVKSSETRLSCPDCGETMERVYSGKMYSCTGKKSGGCSGNCKTCGGCK